MTLDGRAEQVYSTLDDSGLLTLLLVLRSERDRHAQLMSALGEAYREAAGPDAPPASTVGEIVERIDAAAGERPEGFTLVELLQSMLSAEGGDDLAALVHDASQWQAFATAYPWNLARREQWVLDELTRRDLLPTPDRPAAADDADTDAAAAAAATTATAEPAQDPAD